MKLWAHQREAVDKLKNGSVLVGETGSGKSLTALAYYVEKGGFFAESPIPLHIITTAKKRDEGDWEVEANRLGIESVVVDSWNNIKKYVGISDSFFIFDEQRVIGSGVWVKSFIKITKKNHWILLSATPADTWMDLIPVYIANGFYRNRTQFIREHVIYAPGVKYPKITGYLNKQKLRRLRDSIFVVMEYKKNTIQHVFRIGVSYNYELVKDTLKREWNPFSNKPISTFPEQVSVIRRIINSHPSRIFALLKIHQIAQRLIIFYNFNFELEILKTWFGPTTTIAEQNGFKHQQIPDTKDWVYLVQYNSGAEAWETHKTTHMAFYSMNYSYRKMHQARGRIDRHNSPHDEFYYYELQSDSMLDMAIREAFEKKKDFNIRMLETHFTALIVEP